MKKILIYIIVAVAALSLCSCGGRLGDVICDILGIDKNDYSAEATVTVLTEDDEVVLRLAELSKIVCFGDEVITFDSFSDRAGDYVDVVLNYLSGTFYSRYSADRQMMDLFSEKYPELSVNTLIPVSDYENTVYTYFGGNRKATVRSTAMYSYLEKIDAFIQVGQTTECSVDVTVHEAEETESTYRLTVTFYKNSASAGTYDFIFRKRDGGDPYIWRLSKSSKVYGGIK